MMDASGYGSIESGESSPKQSYVEIIVDDDEANQPTLAPVGSRLKRNAQIEYNPFDWRQTLLVVRGRPQVSASYYVVFAIGTILVLISRMVQIAEDDRKCRAWCSRFALGTQPHAYIGFILFLLMSFRTRQSYSNYVSGQTAFYEIKNKIRVFSHVLLTMIDRDLISKSHRARMLAFAIAFPFTVTAEIRKEREFGKSQYILDRCVAMIPAIIRIIGQADQNELLDSCVLYPQQTEKNTVEQVLSAADITLITAARSMPAYVLEAMSRMIEKYGKEAPSSMKKMLHDSVLALYKPYYEAERIASNPMGFSYVAHLRLLLMTYLTTLPLALVEQMGYSTIPVFWVIAYALMSLEMLAVEVENPFGYQGSDLRLLQYNILIRDNVLECWTNWQDDLGEVLDGTDINDYEDFGEKEEEEVWPSWFTYW